MGPEEFWFLTDLTNEEPACVAMLSKKCKKKMKIKRKNKYKGSRNERERFNSKNQVQNNKGTYFQDLPQERK